jgi:hypothetical protein
MNEEQELKKTAVAETPISVHEEPETEKENSSWTEEFIVASEDLLSTIKKLVREVTVRRLVVKNEKMRIHLEIPLALGVAGIAWLPIYSAIALIAALVTDSTILVERHEE